MKASNLLITLTDMVSYSTEEKLKWAVFTVKKRRKKSQNGIYQYQNYNKKIFGVGGNCAFYCIYSYEQMQ
jgi:hypothetical protein